MSTWPPPAPGPGGPSVAPGGIEVGGAHYPVAPPTEWPAHAPMLAPVPPVDGTPAGPPGGGGGRTPALVAAGVVVALLLVAVGVAALTRSGGGDDTATDTTVDLSDPEITAPPSEDPLDPFGGTMPTLPDLGGLDPDEFARPLDEVLPELIAFVERTRGQRFVTEPEVVALDDADFEARYREVQESEGIDLSAESVTGVALGLFDEGTDLTAVAEDTGAAAVAGFYLPTTDELYVRGSTVTPFVQKIIVHELTHALDDQIVDLTRLDELAERTDESAFASLVLVEGTASYVMAEFQAQLPPDEAAALEAEELMSGIDGLMTMFAVPVSYLIEMQIPYSTGQRFVADLVAEGGTAAIDAAYADPPTTSEQVLDADVYRAHEPAVALAPLAADGDVAERGAFGAVDLRMLEHAGGAGLPGLTGDPALIEPIEGYGGGTFVSWTEGSTSCIRIEVVGDDAAASTAIAELVGDWARTVGGADVGSRPGGTGVPVVTAERCA